MVIVVRLAGWTASSEPLEALRGVRGDSSRAGDHGGVRARPALRAAVVDPQGSCQFLAKLRQNFARFRLYRRRSLQLESFGFNFFCSGSPKNYPNP